MSAFSDFGVPGLILCRPIDAYLVYEFLSLFWVNFWSSFKHSDSVEYSGHPRASVTDLQGH